MVIDTSALAAILFGEPEGPDYIQKIARDPKRLIAAFTMLEAAVVIEARKGPSALREYDLFLHEAAFEQVGMDREQVALAREAYQRFGKGRHAAGLNLGDCCAYALAIKTGEPLLYKGDDFTHTDVRRVA